MSLGQALAGREDPSIPYRQGGRIETAKLQSFEAHHIGGMAVG